MAIVCFVYSRPTINCLLSIYGLPNKDVTVVPGAWVQLVVISMTADRLGNKKMC